MVMGKRISCCIVQAWLPILLASLYFSVEDIYGDMIHMIKIIENKCVGCGYCEANCPSLAITVSGLARINMKKCEECMKCLTVCPTNSILMM